MRSVHKPARAFRPLPSIDKRGKAFRVLWYVDLESDSVENATWRAHQLMSGPSALASAFEVEDGVTGEVVVVDLANGKTRRINPEGRYSLRIEDRRQRGGAWLVFVRRGESPIGIGASHSSLALAVRDAMSEVRYRRRAGQFRVARAAES